MYTSLPFNSPPPPIQCHLSERKPIVCARMPLSFTFNQHVFSYIYIWLEQRLPWKWRRPWGFLVSLLFCCLLVFVGCLRDWACKIRRSINSRSRDCSVMHHWESSTQLSRESHWTTCIYCLCDTPRQRLGHNNKELIANDTFIGCRGHSWSSLNKFNEFHSYQEKRKLIWVLNMLCL